MGAAIVIDLILLEVKNGCLMMSPRNCEVSMSLNERFISLTSSEESLLADPDDDDEDEEEEEDDEDDVDAASSSASSSLSDKSSVNLQKAIL